MPPSRRFPARSPRCSTHLEKDNEYLQAGGVFPADLIETWIDYKRTNEVLIRSSCVRTRTSSSCTTTSRRYSHGHRLPSASIRLARTGNGRAPRPRPGGLFVLAAMQPTCPILGDEPIGGRLAARRRAVRPARSVLLLLPWREPSLLSLAVGVPAVAAGVVLGWRPAAAWAGALTPDPGADRRRRPAHRRRLPLRPAPDLLRRPAHGARLRHRARARVERRWAAGDPRVLRG